MSRIILSFFILLLLFISKVSAREHLYSTYKETIDELNNILIKGGYGKEGYSQEYPKQTKIYWESALHTKEIKDAVICEIGFNAGHSCVVWLTANTNATVVMFDLFEHSASPVAEDFLRRKIRNSDRLKIYKGYSAQTLPQAIRDKVQCDILSVDGGHSFETAYSDLLMMENLAKPNHLAFLDDTEMPGVIEAFKVLRRHRKVEVLDEYEKIWRKKNKNRDSVHKMIQFKWLK